MGDVRTGLESSNSNRTFMELKYAAWGLSSSTPILQSHLYGIEI